MTSKHDSDDPEQLFLEQLETIERAIRFVCRRGGLRDHDAEDFASSVKLKLIENEYAVIRKHDRRSSFGGYIAVVVQRFLLDYRIAQWGKWHASAEARRLGEPAITIEAMLYRDGRTIDEIIPVLLRRWPDLTRAAIDEIAKTLPPRARRPRVVDLELASDEVGEDGQSIHEAAEAPSRAAVAKKITDVVSRTMNDLDEEDRLILRLRFEGGMSVAGISRMLAVEQKPLYRRMQRALAKIRGRLARAGVAAEDVNDILAATDTGLDFGFRIDRTDGRVARAEKEES